MSFDIKNNNKSSINTQDSQLKCEANNKGNLNGRSIKNIEGKSRLNSFLKGFFLTVAIIAVGHAVIGIGAAVTAIAAVTLPIDIFIGITAGVLIAGLGIYAFITLGSDVQIGGLPGYNSGANFFIQPK